MSVAPLLPPPAEAEASQPVRSMSGRERARRWRGGLVVLVAVALFATIAVLVDRSGREHGRMDPRSYDPDGARALATLLTERGVGVSRLSSVASVVAHADAHTTVVVADPAGVPDLSPLRQLPAGDTVVLVAPDDASLAAVQPGTHVIGTLGARTVPLDCTQAEAVLAGAVTSGGDSYDSVIGAPAGVRTQARCYDGTVFVQTNASGGRQVDIGSPATLSNDDLGQQGNAALGLGLLGHNPRLLWLVPGPLQAGEATDGTTPLTHLLPGRLGWALLQGTIAVALLMLWRARRLGRVVPEPLPVVVRASETVEGLGRLYRAARARGRAATSLRTATLTRLAPRLGLRRDDGTAAMVDAVSARTGRSPAAVAALLYGPEPEDDRALVALADQLDTLEAEVRRS